MVHSNAGCRYWLDNNLRLPIPHDQAELKDGEEAEHECHYVLRPLADMIPELATCEIPDGMTPADFKTQQDAGMAKWNEVCAHLLFFLPSLPNHCG